MKLVTESQVQKVKKVIPDFMSHYDPKDIFEASKVYESWDEVFESEEYARIWQGFQGKEREERILREYEFVTAYVVEVDPKKNYNRPFQLFTVHKYDGVRILKERTIGSSLDSFPMREVFLLEDAFALGDRYYKKGCKKTWDILKQTESAVR